MTTKKDERGNATDHGREEQDLARPKLPEISRAGAAEPR